MGQYETHQHSSYRGPRGKRKKGPEKIFEEIIVENSLQMGKEIVNQEAQRVHYRINPRRNTLRHILIKLTEIKQRERILKDDAVNVLHSICQ